MNLKLNNENRESQPQPQPPPEHVPFSSAEERRRNGRYISIVVGISLVCLAIYQAWIRQVPVLASLLVPALIMLLYIAWILYTASRDKHRAFNLASGLVVLVDRQQQQSPDEESGTKAPPPEVATATTTTTTTTTTTELAKTNTNTNNVDDQTKVFKESQKEFRRCYSIA